MRAFKPIGPTMQIAVNATPNSANNTRPSARAYYLLNTGTSTAWVAFGVAAADLLEQEGGTTPLAMPLAPNVPALVYADAGFIAGSKNDPYAPINLIGVSGTGGGGNVMVTPGELI